MRGDGNLGGAVLFFSKAQPIADYLVRRPMVTSRWLRLLSPTFFLAANPANLGNTLEMAITLCRFGVRRFARHCRAAFRLGGGSRVEENVHVHSEKSWPLGMTIALVKIVY